MDQKYWLFLLFFLLSLIFLSSCVSQQEVLQQQRHDQLSVEWNKYVNTYNEDTLEMNGIMGKYNLKTIDIDERIDIVNEYIRFYNIRVNHLSAFYSFIIFNEQELKLIGIDTYDWEKNIQDSSSILRNNIEEMKMGVETILQYEEQLRNLQQQQTLSSQQIEGYTNLLKLLGALI